jgi:hypothetical protein
VLRDRAAAEVESEEPDYWVSTDGLHVDFGMRGPMAEDDGANWCPRTEVNQHINDRMCEQPGLRLHLEPLYRNPPSAVPEARVESAYLSDYEKGYVEGWNDCRDEMLAAAPQGDSHHE